MENLKMTSAQHAVSEGDDDEVSHGVNDAVEEAVNDTQEGADAGGIAGDDDDDYEEPPHFPVEKPVAKVLSRVAIPGSAGSLNQRRIDVRWGVSDNATRTSRLRPDAKHLTVKLPDALVRLFTGVWVAEDEDIGKVYIDFFARSLQDDRSGFKGGAWRWIKIKPSGECAIAINRPYTKSRCDDVLVRDFDMGAFMLVVPLELSVTASEPVANQTADRRLVS